MKPTITVKCILLLLFGTGLFIAGCSPVQQTDSPEETAQGEIIFSVTDAAADMNSISEVRIGIEQVELYHAQQGWIKASETPVTFNLLELKETGALSLLSKTNISEGRYSRSRLSLSSVTVFKTNGTQHQATLPSETMTFNTDFSVEENATTASTLDVQTDESLHTTENGTYVFAPVIEHTTKEQARVSVNARYHVSIEGGRVASKAKVGMRSDGSAGINAKIPKNAAISVENERISITTGQDRAEERNQEGSGTVSAETSTDGEMNTTGNETSAGVSSSGSISITG